jgi:hypothetical protein
MFCYRKLIKFSFLFSSFSQHNQIKKIQLKSSNVTLQVWVGKHGKTWKHTIRKAYISHCQKPFVKKYDIK